jgi:dCTP deaminase
MVLSDRDIKTRLKIDLVITPLDESCIQPSSIDVHLDDNFLVFDNHNLHIIDTRNPIKDLMKRILIKKDVPFILHPREFILGTTIERIEVPNDLVCRLEGKSSLGRMGLIIHSTAGYIDPGFKGQVTLEISNLSNLPIALYKDMKIGQFSFIQMTSPAEFPYGHSKLGSHYQNQTGATESRMK